MHTRAATTRKAWRRTALTAVGVLAVAALTLIAPVASAAAPDNDSWMQATDVTGLPFEDSVDTTEATADRGGPDGLGRYHQYSIWYHVNLPAEGRLLISTRDTDYPHKLVVYQAASATQSPSEWIKLDGSRAWRSAAGSLLDVQADTDYFVVIGALKGYPGGTAEIIMRPPAQIIITLEDVGTFDPVDGSALLEGTMVSDQPTEVDLQVGLQQLVGERVVRGFGRKHLLPTAEPAPWEVRVSGEYGFKLGQARIINRRVRAYDLGVRVPVERFTQDLVTLQ